MNKTYVIRWKSRINGRSGTGTTKFDQEAAEKLAEELNRDYPEIDHQALSMETEAQPEAPVLLPAGHTTTDLNNP